MSVKVVDASVTESLDGRPDDVVESCPPPESWHHTVIFHLLQSKPAASTTAAARGKRVLWFASLCLLVAAQMIALVAIIRALDPYMKACDDNGDCAKVPARTPPRPPQAWLWLQTYSPPLTGPQSTPITGILLHSELW